MPATVLGRTGGASLEVAGSFTIGLDELAAAHRGTAARPVRLKVLAGPGRLRAWSRTRRAAARPGARRHGASCAADPPGAGRQAPAVAQVAQLPVVKPARPGVRSCLTQRWLAARSAPPQQHGPRGRGWPEVELETGLGARHSPFCR